MVHVDLGCCQGLREVFQTLNWGRSGQVVKHSALIKLFQVNVVVLKHAA